MEPEITDEEFARLKREIEKAWAHYQALQKIFNRKTGQDYRWFK